MGEGGLKNKAQFYRERPGRAALSELRNNRAAAQYNSSAWRRVRRAAGRQG